MTELAADVRLAADIAAAAGDVLSLLQRSGLYAGRALGDAGDAAAHEVIVRALRHARPDDAILSEEGARDPARLEASRVWIVDPLDGTREYSEGRSDWAVHVALSVDGRAVGGAVARPGLGLVLDSETVRAVDPGPGLKLVVSRTRPPALVEALAAELGAELVPMGSAGAKTTAVVLGEAHAYVHAGGQYEWDNCAPAAVAQAAGLYVSRLDGSPLVYNREPPSLPDLVVCRPELRERLMGAVARLLQQA